VDPNVVVVKSVAVRIAVIRIAATHCAVIQIVVILFAVRVVAPSVALNVATPNVVLSVAQDVARDGVIPCAVSPCAVDQCVENQGAMVDSQDEDLPSDAQGVWPVDLLSLVAVQSEVAPDAALFSVLAPV